jgi:antirestriction protein ArdC
MPGINILSLWMPALIQNLAAPIWMTYRQAGEFSSHVRKGCQRHHAHRA